MHLSMETQGFIQMIYGLLSFSQYECNANTQLHGLEERLGERFKRTVGRN